MTKDQMIRILEENRDLIENKKFGMFYLQIFFGDRHYFTDLFLKSGINPLNYMKEVPQEFASFFDNLNQIIIPKNIKKIGRGAFYRSGLSIIDFENGSNLNWIEPYAFGKCINLTSIWLPKNIKYIGEGAFMDCDNLKNIYYEGSEQDWNTLNINKYNQNLFRAKIHFNSKQ